MMCSVELCDTNVLLIVALTTRQLTCNIILATKLKRNVYVLRIYFSII